MRERETRIYNIILAEVARERRMIILVALPTVGQFEKQKLYMKRHKTKFLISQIVDGGAHKLPSNCDSGVRLSFFHRPKESI